MPFLTINSPHANEAYGNAIHGLMLMNGRRRASRQNVFGKEGKDVIRK